MPPITPQYLFDLYANLETESFRAGLEAASISTLTALLIHENIKDPGGHRILHLIAFGRDIESLRIIRQRFIDQNITFFYKQLLKSDNCGKTALDYAVMIMPKEATAKLIADIDADSLTSHINTTLFLHSLAKYLAINQIANTLKNKIKPEQLSAAITKTDDFGETALHVAARFQDAANFITFLQLIDEDTRAACGCNISIALFDLIFERFKDPTQLATILNLFNDLTLETAINSVDDEGKPLLHRLAERSQHRAIAELIKRCGQQQIKVALELLDKKGAKGVYAVASYCDPKIFIAAIKKAYADSEEFNEADLLYVVTSHFSHANDLFILRKTITCFDDNVFEKILLLKTKDGSPSALHRLAQKSQNAAVIELVKRADPKTVSSLLPRCTRKKQNLLYLLTTLCNDETLDLVLQKADSTSISASLVTDTDKDGYNCLRGAVRTKSVNNILKLIEKADTNAIKGALRFSLDFILTYDGKNAGNTDNIICTLINKCGMQFFVDEYFTPKPLKPHESPPKQRPSDPPSRNDAIDETSSKRTSRQEDDPFNLRVATQEEKINRILKRISRNSPGSVTSPNSKTKSPLSDEEDIDELGDPEDPDLVAAAQAWEKRQPANFQYLDELTRLTRFLLLDQTFVLTSLAPIITNVNLIGYDKSGFCPIFVTATIRYFASPQATKENKNKVKTILSHPPFFLVLQRYFLDPTIFHDICFSAPQLFFLYIEKCGFDEKVITHLRDIHGCSFAVLDYILDTPDQKLDGDARYTFAEGLLLSRNIEKALANRRELFLWSIRNLSFEQLHSSLQYKDDPSSPSSIEILKSAQTPDIQVFGLIISRLGVQHTTEMTTSLDFLIKPLLLHLATEAEETKLIEAFSPVLDANKSVLKYTLDQLCFTNERFLTTCSRRGNGLHGLTHSSKFKFLQPYVEVNIDESMIRDVRKQNNQLAALVLKECKRLWDKYGTSSSKAGLFAKKPESIILIDRLSKASAQAFIPPNDTEKLIEQLKKDKQSAPFLGRILRCIDPDMTSRNLSRPQSPVSSSNGSSGPGVLPSNSPPS